MLTKEELRFILAVTDYFHGHWEDPEWGRRIDQGLKKINVYIAASEIEDKNVRTVIQNCIERNMAGAVRELRPTTDPISPRG